MRKALSMYSLHYQKVFKKKELDRIIMTDGKGISAKNATMWEEMKNKSSGGLVKEKSQLRG